MLTHKRKECLSYGRGARSQHVRVLLWLCILRGKQDLFNPNKNTLLVLNWLKPKPYKLIFNGHKALILGARLNRDGCGHFFKREAITSSFLKCQLESTSAVAGLTLTSFSNWRTALPIQFHACNIFYSCS